MSNLQELYDQIGLEYDHDSVTDAQDEDYRGEFRIEDQGGALWAMRKIKAINGRINEFHTTAKEEYQRIIDWETQQVEKAQKEIAFFESLLHEYADTLRAEDPKFTSLALPHGKISYRKQAAEYTRDNDRLLKWVKANRPEFVRIKEEPDWLNLKKEIVTSGEMAVDKNGEIVDGVTVTERPDKFIVEVL